MFILLFLFFTLISQSAITASRPPLSYSDSRSRGSSSDSSSYATFSAGSGFQPAAPGQFFSIEGLSDLGSSSIHDDIDTFFKESKRTLRIGDEPIFDAKSAVKSAPLTARFTTILSQAADRELLRQTINTISLLWIDSARQYNAKVIMLMNVPQIFYFLSSISDNIADAGTQTRAILQHYTTNVQHSDEALDKLLNLITIHSMTRELFNQAVDRIVAMPELPMSLTQRIEIFTTNLQRSTAEHIINTELIERTLANLR